MVSIPDKNYHYKPFKVKAFFYFRILGEYLRVTTIMKNMATIIQAFENDKQYEIELISTHIIPYFRLVVYGVLTTKL